jgi:parvulin-like peptidyl-prolyl isomerase
MFIITDNPEKRSPLNPIILFMVFVFLIITVLASPACSEDEKKATDQNPKADISGEGAIVADVNGKAVTTGDLLKQYNLYFIMSRVSRTYKEGLTVNSYLDHYISELLLLNMADNMGIKAGPDEVEKELQRYLNLFRATEENFARWLNSKSLTRDDAKVYLKNRIILSRLREKKFGEKKISEEELKAYYHNNNDFFNRPAKIMASHILICHTESEGCKSNLTRNEAKELAEKIRKTTTPENFAESAKKYSYDSTGKSGGGLGIITEGLAAPSFEKAAFALQKGGLSDVVETNYGFHIIYVTDKAEALFIPFEDAKESIKYTLEEEQVLSELLRYAEQLKKDAKIKRYTLEERKDAASKQHGHENSINLDASVKRYSTFKATGKGLNKNDKGQPVIILFTRKGCHFCEWVEGTFEDTVKEYMEKGLIEAHHYDFQTKDDLLTPEIETSIPEQYLKLFDHENPNSSTPCFNFGGLYYRLGTGYFDQDDLNAEEMEMRQVIDDLIGR